MIYGTPNSYHFNSQYVAGDLSKTKLFKDKTFDSNTSNGRLNKD